MKRLHDELCPRVKRDTKPCRCALISSVRAKEHLSLALWIHDQGPVETVAIADVRAFLRRRLAAHPFCLVIDGEPFPVEVSA